MMSGQLLIINDSFAKCQWNLQFTQVTALPVIIIEVQSGDYEGEDDIIRFEDIYG